MLLRVNKRPDRYVPQFCFRFDDELGDALREVEKEILEADRIKYERERLEFEQALAAIK